VPEPDQVDGAGGVEGFLRGSDGPVGAQDGVLPAARKVVSPNNFACLEDLSVTLLAFTERYNQTAKPFNWRFTAADLGRLLERISVREESAGPASLPEAA
jgi:hypothetical protein